MPTQFTLYAYSLHYVFCDKTGLRSCMRPYSLTSWEGESFEEQAHYIKVNDYDRIFHLEGLLCCLLNRIIRNVTLANNVINVTTSASSLSREEKQHH